MNTELLREAVVRALRTILDPELSINIYDLGLVYELEVHPLGLVTIRMTLTAPGCPVAQHFPSWVSEVVSEVPGVTAVDVQLVWSPPWTIERMDWEARWQLDLV